MVHGERIADLTVDELRKLIRDTVREAFADVIGAADPDGGLQIREDVADYLRTIDPRRTRGTPAVDVLRDLGLDGDE